MKKLLQTLFTIIITTFSIVGFVGFFVIIFDNEYFQTTYKFDPKLAADFGTFFGGFIGTIFSIVSVLLLIYTIISQNSDSKRADLETNFFRMIDYHNQNVNQIKVTNLDTTKNDISEGRRTFVQFKIQIHRLLPIVSEVNIENNLNLDKNQQLDIAYIIFYYGLEGSWMTFITEKLQRYPQPAKISQKILEKLNAYPQLKYGRTNQTNLSTYFRNMYNAIKMVDESRYLTTQQKQNLIKIYKAQLSNPELYIIFFNVLSRFGKKWKENGYITKYEFLRNIPKDYCDGYDPKQYFPMIYEYEEY
ncbi:putative phage abortive infection protein [Flavobacterium sp. CAU 1735]|uniref:putative phage abortive infection protein n=1 Tax=Flavobacterium sp. CAU 1735 TaxID=3140361 RepID=UPI00326019EF